MGEDNQAKPKSLFLKISGNPMDHPGSLEGLRCARGFAADGRWRVTVEICSECVEYFIETQENLQGTGFTSIEELSGLVRFVIASNSISHTSAIPDWIHPLTTDEALLLGLAADVVLMF